VQTAYDIDCVAYHSIGIFCQQEFLKSFAWIFMKFWEGDWILG